MSTAAPFLNDYKAKFVRKRLVQNILGGLILKIDSDDNVPWFIYILQIFLFVTPLCFGGISILIIDVSQFSRLNVSLISTGLFLLYIISLKTLSIIVNNRKSSRNSILSSQNTLTRDLKEEENYDFEDKFLSLTTINFLLPPQETILATQTNSVSKLKLASCVFRVFVDSVVSSFIMFCGIYLLSTNYLFKYYNTAGVIFIFILNWLVLLLTFNPICIRAPPEPAIYQQYGTKYQHLFRSFYVIIFQITELILTSLISNQAVINTVFWLKIITSLLPIAWLFGVLPPIDGLVLFLLEQFYIFVYGGTATSNNLRLFMQLLGSLILSIVYFIPNNLAIAIILAVFGYVFASVDLLYIFETILKFLKRKVSSQSVTPSTNDANNSNLNKITTNEPIYKCLDWLYHSIMLVLIIGCVVSVILILDTTKCPRSTSLVIQTSLLYSGIAVFVLVKILGDLQRVYCIFGLIRNPFYPKECLSSSINSNKKQIESVNQNKLHFKIAKYTRISLLRIVTPLLLCTIISIDCQANGIYNDLLIGYWRIVCVLRAFRWIWQSSYSCLIEMCIMTHLSVFTIYYSSTSDTNLRLSIDRHFLVACLFASFVKDRLEQLCNKFFTFFLITITSWTIKKQRRRSSLLFIVLNFVFFMPFGLALLAVTSVLSAPILPLFTFPLFLITFPRNKKFWPEKTTFSVRSLSAPGNSSTNTNSVASSDSSFYVQIVPELVKSFKEHIRSGSVGGSLQPDTFFLSRFQDRIMWIQVLESSSSYYIINIKGLELQETSCHTREAQYIDDTFDMAFENPTGSTSNDTSQKKKLFNVNPSFFSCFTPMDVLVFEAYSDAKNSLVGILDNPETIQRLADFFPKIFNYFLLEHLLRHIADTSPGHQTRDISESSSQSSVDFRLNENYLNEKENDHHIDYTLHENSFLNNNKSLTEIMELKEAQPLSNISSSKSKDVSGKPGTDDKSEWSDDDSEEDFSVKKGVRLAAYSSKIPVKVNKQKAMTGETDSFEFDFNEILGAVNSAQKPQHDSPPVSSKKPKQPSPRETSPDKPSIVSRPAVFEKVSSTKNPVTKVLKTKKSSEPLLATPVSSVCLPRDWTNIYKDSQSVHNDNPELKSTLMSKEWTGQLIKFLSKSPKEKEVFDDYEANSSATFCMFILKTCVNLGLTKKNVVKNFSTSAINNFFQGNLPWSPLNEKITKEHQDLHKLLVKSFQYTVKMAVDDITISPIENDSDFFVTLKEYNEEWFVGRQDETGFSKGILENTKYLFSVYNDEKTKTISSRTLSLQKIKSPIVKLNSEVVKSIWSSTNLELLFMTNDDDERYSIQANHLTLRNITIQSSEPPLGYCIYNSDNITIPIVNPFY